MIVMSALCQKETLSGSFNHLIGAVEQKKSPDISAGVSDLILQNGGPSVAAPVETPD
jgi:hypothetical protein